MSKLVNLMLERVTLGYAGSIMGRDVLSAMARHSLRAECATEGEYERKLEEYEKNHQDRLKALDAEIDKLEKIGSNDDK